MKLSTVSNTLGRSFLIFIIIYLWASYYMRGMLFILFFSVGITFLVNYLVFKVGNRRNAGAAVTRRAVEHQQKTILQLKFLTKTQTLRLFKKALAQKFECTHTAKKLIIQTPASQIELFSLFHKEPTLADIIECINAGAKGGTILIAAENFAPQITAFVKALKINVQLLDGGQVYRQILNPAEVYPEFTVEFKSGAARSLKHLKSVVFARERTKGYIITGTIIFLTSFLVRYNIYYIVIATAVFALALSSYYSPNSAKNIFDL